VAGLDEALKVINDYEQGNHGDLRGIEGPTGRVRILGAPQDCPKTPTHQATVAETAARWALSGEYKTVGMDRGINEVVGEGVCNPNIRPDVYGIRPNGQVDMLEVRSVSQSHKYLRGKLEKARGQMPRKQQGNIDVINPFPKD